jgi:small conductance mechanosensitive channel
MISQIGAKILKIIIILIIGEIAKKVVSVFVRRLRRGGKKFKNRVSPKQTQRIRTLRRLITNSVKIIINLVVFVMIISELGVNIAPLIAGAGILGLAVGFGAKSLVSDLIAGFFIILENQFNVGDTIQIGSHQGRVVKITLRTITLKDKEKKTYIIPNSSIKAVIKFPPSV